MKELRKQDVPLACFLGPQLEWLYLNYPVPQRLPNDLTKLRMWLVPVQLPLLILGLVLGNQFCIQLSLFVLWVQGVSDWLDGYFAYHYDAASDEGAQLDPRADKLVVLPNLLVFGAWTVSQGHYVSGATLILITVVLTGLDVESDIWYRHNKGGKSNNYGKIKFCLQILVAIIGVSSMTLQPDFQCQELINFLAALILVGASLCARISLNLKKTRTVVQNTPVTMPSLIEGLARSTPQSD